MVIMEFNEREKSLIEILRNFGFIKEYGYKEYKFLYYVNAYPSVYFKNYQLNQILSIIGSDFGSNGNEYSIIIERRSIFSYKVIDVSDYYGTFGTTMIKGKNYSLKSQAEFVQMNLIPILKGKIWVDELKRK
jgi:hypothetical protein